ncbi:energy transducer TonB [Porticoccus sp.]
MWLLRYTVAASLALLVTLALLLGMQGLISTVGDTPDAEPRGKLADIWQPRRSIEEQRKTPKPDKPEAPEPPPPSPPDIQVNVAVPVAAVSMSLPSVAGLEIGMGGAFSRDSDYIPVYVPQPDYPPRALRQGLDGYAVVEVTITTTGSVRDIKLLEEYPTNRDFGKYALRAAEKLKYKPRVVDGVAEEVPGVLYKFSFRIAR